MDYLWNQIKNIESKVYKYKNRSAVSLSGISRIDSKMICNLKNINSKMLNICLYAQLSGNGISQYGYFSPIDEDGIFQLRISNHENHNSELYARTETLGVPNVRNIIVFSGNGNSIETYSTKENHGVVVSRNDYIFPTYYFDYQQNVELFKTALEGMFHTGLFIPPKNFEKPSRYRYTDESKQHITDSINIILTESQLCQIIENVTQEVICKY